jgi:hypothetical protein
MKRKREVKKIENDPPPTIDTIQKEIEEIKTNPATVFMENYLRANISDEFSKYMAKSPLKHISNTIQGVDTTLFEPDFTKMILRTATPQYGIILSLNTYLNALSNFTSDVNYILATRHNYGSDMKNVAKLELRFEEEPITTFEKHEHAKTLSNPKTKVNKNPVLMALFKDKQQYNYYHGYRDNDKQHVFLYTAYLNNKFICSMIIPHASHTKFQVTVLTENENNNNNNLMTERYKNNYIALKKSELELSNLKSQLKEKTLLLKERENEMKFFKEKNTELQKELVSLKDNS